MGAAMRIAGGIVSNGKPGATRHRAGAILSAGLVALAIGAAAIPTPALAQIATDEFVAERTFFRTQIGGKSVRLEGLVLKRADLTGKLPVALITHGKSANLTDMLESKAADYAGSARDLARRGWLSVVVMRRGFGQSDGPMPVDLTCDTTTFANRFAADADDLQGAMDIIVKRPDADPDRAIAIGVSAGGAAAMAFAARNPRNLKGVVNVSGGLAMPACPKEDVLVNAFKDFGATSRVPTLWVYAKNDSLFGPNVVERMQSSYLDGGGDVKLVMFDKHGNDGHSIFADASGRLKWLMEMDGFLRFHELPTARRDSVPELMKLLKLSEANRAFLENYLAAPTYKAMAQTADGKSHATQYGAQSMEVARKAVLEYCQEQFKAAEPCKIVMENDTWTGPQAIGSVERKVERPVAER
jgi:dienelactone hydrolase